MNWTFYPARVFPELQSRWQSLNHDSVASPLLREQFVLPLLTEFGSGNELLACCEHNDEVHAMAILTPRGRGVWETFQPSQAPIGMWLQRTEADYSQLLAALTRKLPGFPLMLGVTQQDPQLFPRPKDEASLKTLDYIQTAKVTLQGSFDDYWSARGKNLRHNMKKQRNKLEKEGVNTRLQLSTAPGDVSQAIADYGKLESSGWKAQLGTAIHPGNAQGRFYQTMLEAFCRRGAGRIYRYWYNDSIVAMDLCIEGDGTLIILKTTYDESIKDGTSPAFLLRQEQFKELFDEAGLRSVEFYGKVMEWHLKWTEEVRTMYHVNHYRFAVLPLLHNAIKRPAAMMNK
jgi:CelD/BcsL family acetyltransferase involved in cellulose biosynthesis